MAISATFCVVAVILLSRSVDAAPTDQDVLVDQLKNILSERQGSEKGIGSGKNDLLNERDQHGRSYFRESGENRRNPPIINDNQTQPRIPEGHYFFDPSAARAYTARGPGLTQAQKDRVVEMHNQLRRQEGASNMERMRWNDRLGQLAQDWADRCAYGHRPSSTFNPQDYGVPNVGENLWAWSDTSSTIPDKAIQMWYDEKPYYIYNSNQCTKEPCGHYTTVTWATTTDVGCGYAECPFLRNVNYNNGAYMVCNYGPWGAGEQPFKKGSPCTECDRGQFYCSNNLCDSQCNSGCQCKAQCISGTQTSDCKCQCRPGATGPACGDSCTDKDPNCGANPGWPESWCTDKTVFGGLMYDQVNQKCPKMCKKCQARSDNLEQDAKGLDDGELEFLIAELQDNN